MQIAVLFALVSVACAGVVVPAGINTGASQQFRTQDNAGNYAFGYNEDHSTGGTFRRETGGPGWQQGSYGLRDIDGRNRIVNYVADGLGYRANIQTNEPGVEPKDPAAVSINKAHVAVAPVVAAAPLIAAPAVAAYAAPIAHAAPLAYGGYGGAYGGAVIAHAPRTVSSYSTSVAHANAAPILAGYAHGGLAAPVLAGHGGYGAYGYGGHY